MPPPCKEHYIMANEPWTTRGRSQYIGRPHIELRLDEGLAGSSTSSAAADGNFTTPSYFAAASDGVDDGGINLSVSGTFVGTVTLQRSFDDGVTWVDVEQYTAPVEKVIENIQTRAKWRLGVKDGDYGSGDILMILSQV